MSSRPFLGASRERVRSTSSFAGWVDTIRAIGCQSHPRHLPNAGAALPVAWQMKATNLHMNAMDAGLRPHDCVAVGAHNRARAEVDDASDGASVDHFFEFAQADSSLVAEPEVALSAVETEVPNPVVVVVVGTSSRARLQNEAM
ncbi:hypothetical protein [Candidatus Poriferisodalis sp.]|uniref:hypothetical protein n=1 Tax=Candidatus Poriferisodalis sp. TaxID=3101277 RepID=UPI003B02CE13